MKETGYVFHHAIYCPYCGVKDIYIGDDGSFYCDHCNAIFDIFENIKELIEYKSQR